MSAPNLHTTISPTVQLGQLICSLLAQFIANGRNTVESTFDVPSNEGDLFEVRFHMTVRRKTH